MGKELFVGTFVHSLGLQELQVSENGVIGVQDGKIVFVEKDVGDLKSLKSTKGFEDAEVRYTHDEDLSQVTQLTGSQFFIPGFIDCHIVRTVWKV